MYGLKFKLTGFDSYSFFVKAIGWALPGLLLLNSHSQASMTQKSSPSNIHFERVFDGHDVAVRAVNDIVQDSQGFMWFGTERGLYRYDGYELKKFGDTGTRETLTNITSLHIPRGSQTLWVGGYDRLVEFNLRDYSYIAHKADDPQGITLRSYYITELGSTPSGDLIIATGFGVYTLTKADKTLSFHSALTPEDEISDEIVWSTFFDAQTKKLWMGTNSGVRLMDWVTHTVTYPAILREELKGINVNDIHKDRHGNLWLATYDGLYRLNKEETRYEKYVFQQDDPRSIGANIIWSVFEDKEGNIWAGTDHGGLNVFDRVEGGFNRFMHSASSPTSISSNTVRAIVQDNLGNMWAGNFPTGVNHFSPYDSPLKQDTHIENYTQSLSHNSVLALLEDRDGSIWIGTDGGGLNKFNPTTAKYVHYNQLADGLASSVILSLATDESGTIWIGTYRDGVKKYGPRSGKFSSILTDLTYEGGKISAWSLLRDSQGNLWVGTQRDGAYQYNLHDGSVTHHRLIPKGDEGSGGQFVFAAEEDSNGNIWMGTRSGVSLLRKDAAEFVYFRNDNSDPKALRDNVIFSIYEDSNQRVWFGTRGGLSLLDQDSLTFKTLSQEDGLSSNAIRSIAEDHQNNLWVGTDQGISRIDTKTFSIQNHRNGIGWLPGPYNSAAIKTRSGILGFGGINGLQWLDTRLYRAETTPPRIAFTDFQLFAESVLPNDKLGLLTQVINHTNSVTLKYDQNMFAIEFAALNYQDTSKNHYAYKLEGFDKDWREIGSKRSAVYTNIDPGSYTFRVKASNSFGVWNEDGISLKIVQHAAPWKTWWAYLGYLSLAMFVIYWLVRQKIKKLEFERNLQTQSNAKLLQLNQLKSNFLANTSHELLTPLNGIIGISMLLKDDLTHIDADAHKKLAMIYNSGKRLSGLVRDILDFSLVSENKLQLNLEVVNLAEAVESCIDLLKPITQAKTIFLLNKVSDKGLYIQADPERLRHILQNLLSNGVKYTNEGHVTISADIDGDSVVIAVQDSGIGIAEKEIKTVFQAFDQLDDANTNPHGGAGLGLSLTQKLVELHGSTIDVDSQVGVGSKFSFKLKIATEEQVCEHLSAKNLSHHSGTGSGDRSANDSESSLNKKDEQKRILIVDDDTVNRIVLRGILELKDYQVIEADSGLQALECIEQHNNISLIVLDIMMPQMDGYEVCKKLREKYPIDRLPIIFLTAKTTEEAFREGMEAGGNDFLTKPASKTLLLPKVSKLLDMCS